MNDEAFRKLCNVYGFAPSRALREMLDAAMKEEREACAKVCEEFYSIEGIAQECATAIRAREQT